MSRAAVAIGGEGIYAAARTLVIGEDQDGGLCFVVECDDGSAVGVPLDRASAVQIFDGLLIEMSNRGWLAS